MNNPTAILIVDVQYGFLNANTADLPGKIRKLLEERPFDHRIFTEFHNRENSPFERFMDWSDLKTPHQVETVRELQPLASVTFRKSGYTAVTQELIAYLNGHGIKEVRIAGIDTDACVLLTAADLFQIGIRPIVLADYCASTAGKETHEAALSLLPRIIGANQIKRTFK